MHPQPAVQEGGPAVFALQAAAHAAGSPLLGMTSDESIRAAVTAASALDNPQVTPRALLERLQALQAEARHASQTTRLNTCAPLSTLLPLVECPGRLCPPAGTRRCMHTSVG